MSTQTTRRLTELCWFWLYPAIVLPLVYRFYALHQQPVFGGPEWVFAPKFAAIRYWRGRRLGGAGYDCRCFSAAHGVALRQIETVSGRQQRHSSRPVLWPGFFRAGGVVNGLGMAVGYSRLLADPTALASTLALVVSCCALPFFVFLGIQKRRQMRHRQLKQGVGMPS